MTHPTRTTVVVGRIGPEGTEVAYRCTCGAWTNEEDGEMCEACVYAQGYLRGRADCGSDHDIDRWFTKNLEVPEDDGGSAV